MGPGSTHHYIFILVTLQMLPEVCCCGSQPLTIACKLHQRMIAVMEHLDAAAGSASSCWALPVEHSASTCTQT